MPINRCPRKPTAIAFAAVATLLLSVSVSAQPAAKVSAARRPAAKAATAPAPPTSDYWVYVGAESADLIHRIRFGPKGAVVERTTAVGELAAEMEGPHGLQISRDGKYLHMTTGHGTPDGKYWKFALGPDTLVGPPIFLGNFPASIDVTPDGLYAFAVNFNLHGEMVPSSVSVIYTPTNTEVAQTTTCTMPHGSRLDPSGRRQYSTCMMDDQLVELDAVNFGVARRFSLAKGKEGPVTVAAANAHAGHDMAAMAMSANGGAKPDSLAEGGGKMTMNVSCSPTWAQPSFDGAKIFVACNKIDEIVEVDQASWAVTRRFKTGRGPYNIAVSPDGRLLVASLKQGAAVQVFDLATGRSVMQVPSSIKVTHGVVVSPDSRYAFVSNEGVGAQPGKVDVYDLKALVRVASVDVGQQAGGIAFWKMEPAARVGR